jgi:hypothetical protein
VRLLALLLALPLLTSVLVSSPADAGRAHHVVGADISWPQCPKDVGIKSRRGMDLPMPRASARYVVIGLTNGPGFFPNPCIKSQVRWAKRHHVWTAAYAVTTYPRARQLAKYGTTGPHSSTYLHGKLWNAGYAEAEFNIATMKGVHLTSPIVWVDVEPYSVRPWTRHRTRNAAVVQGAVQGYQDAGLKVGFYSTQLLWRSIVDHLHYGLPEWRTAGPRTMAAALRMCSHDPIQGGRAVLAQWWDDDRDFGVTCPGHSSRPHLRKYFHRY